MYVDFVFADISQIPVSVYLVHQSDFGAPDRSALSNQATQDRLHQAIHQ